MDRGGRSALAMATLLLGWGCEPIEAPVEAPAPGIRRDAVCTYGPFGAPVPITEVNSNKTEWAASISRDGLTLYFVSNRPGGTGGFDLYRATRGTAGGVFTSITEVTELNTPGDDFGPQISSDDLTMYWARPVGSNLELYVASRPSPTQPFDGGTPLIYINSPATDDTPSITDDGLYLALRSDRSGGLGGSDVYLASRTDAGRPFTTARNVTEVNSTAIDEGAFLSGDGLTLMFASNRSGGPGGFDLYLATRAQEQDVFSAPSLVTELSTAFDDNDVDLSPDTRTVYFSSNRPGGLGDQDLWMATRDCLGADAGTPDAGGLDGGVADGGGAPGDAGEGDGGASDAGAGDGGTGAAPRETTVGCDCSSAGFDGVLFSLLLPACVAARRRRLSERR